MKRKKIAAAVLSLTLALTACLGSAASVFAATYPSDIMGTKYQVAVTNLVDRGILSGSDDGKFHPEKAINRAELAKIMAIAGNRTGELQTAANKTIFNDMTGYEWAKGYVNVCADAGILNGMGGDKYAPGKEVSYAELITTIIRQKNPSGGEAFPGEWPKNYITYAEMYNMMRDIYVTDWNAPAPRGEVALLIYYNLPKGSSTGATLYLSQDKKIATAGESVTFVATATGSGTLSYSWSVDGVVKGGDFSSFVYVVPDSGVSHDIAVTVTNSQSGKNPVTTTATAKVN